MKRLLTLAVLCLLVLPSVGRADEPTADDLYFSSYSLMLKAENLEAKGRSAEARTNYQEADRLLKTIQLDFPDWNPKVIKYRINYFEGKLATPPAKAPVKSAAPAISSAAGPAEKMSITVPSRPPGDAVTMQIKWNAGKRYVHQLSLTIDADVNLPAPNPPQKGQLTLTQGLAISALKDRDGGGKELELELLDTAASVKSSGAEMFSYDSQKHSGAGLPPDAMAILDKLKGSKLKLLTTADGNIDSVEGIEDLIKRLAPPDANVSAADLTKSIPADTLSQLKGAFADIAGLPDHPVKVGDSWNQKTPPQVAGAPPIDQNVKYTFQGWEDRDNRHCALIQVAGDVNTKPGANTMPGMPSVKVHTTGKIWFDPDLGMIVGMDSRPDVTLNMGTPGQPGAVTVGLKVKVLTKLEDVASLAP